MALRAGRGGARIGQRDARGPALEIGTASRIPLLDTWLISAASNLLNFIVPLRTGELARGLLLKQCHSVAISAALPTVAVDRSFDLLAVFVLGSLGALSGVRLGARLSTVLLTGAFLFLAFAAFSALAILSRQCLLALADGLLPARLSDGLRPRLLGIFEGLLIGFEAVWRTRPSGLAAVLSLSLLAAVLDSGLFYLLFLGLGAAIPPAVVMTGYALFALTFLVPGAPGYVGSMEALGSLVFGTLGIGRDLAASGVVLFHSLNATTLVLMGAPAMRMLSVHPSSILRSIFRSSGFEAGTGPPASEP